MVKVSNVLEWILLLAMPTYGAYRFTNSSWKTLNVGSSTMTMRLGAFTWTEFFYCKKTWLQQKWHAEVFPPKTVQASNTILLCIEYLVFICLFNYYGIVSLSKANDMLDKSFFDSIWKFYFLPCHVWVGKYPPCLDLLSLSEELCPVLPWPRLVLLLLLSRAIPSFSFNNCT